MDPVLTKKNGSRALYLKRREIFLIYQINILDNFEAFFIVFILLVSRRSIDVLDSGNQSGSGSRALGITEDVWHQKYDNKKEGFQNYLEYSFSLLLSYRALYPFFWAKNRIHITASWTVDIDEDIPGGISRCSEWISLAPDHPDTWQTGTQFPPDLIKK